MSTAPTPDRATPYALHLFGGIRLVGPAGPVEGRASQRRQLAVLAVLAVSGQHGVTRDRLLGLLWGDTSERQARHHLSDALYFLHHELGAEALVEAGGSLSLNRAVVWSDAAAFDAAIGRGEAEAAVGLYVGPLLEGFYLNGARSFNEWVEGERQRYAITCEETLEALARAAAGVGDFAQATGWWQRLVALDPYNSRAVLALMQARVSAGDPANALLHLSLHTGVLREQLGIEPDPELVAYGERLQRELRVQSDASVSRVAGPSNGPPVALGSHSDRAPPSPQTRTLSWHRHPWVWAAVVLVVAVGGWISHAVSRAERHGTGINPSVYAVLPFDVAGADDSLVDVFAMDIPRFFAGIGGRDGVIRAADFETVMPAWERERDREGGHLTRDGQLAVARFVGAGRVVSGRLLIGDGRVVIEASVITSPGGRTVTTQRVEGVWTDRTALVDQLVLKLLVAEFGDMGEFPRLGNHDRQAVYLYLEGLRLIADFRLREAQQQFRAALALDSTFGEAAFAWYLANEPEDAMHRAWALRHRLSPRDSAFLHVDAGLRLGLYHGVAEWLAARDTLAKLYPEWGTPWQDYAQSLRTWGPYLFEDWLWRSWDAVNRAIAFSDSSQLGMIYDGISLNWQFGDRTRARQLAVRARTIGMETQAPAWRWMVAYLLGDETERTRALAAHATDPRFFPQWPTGFAIVNGEAFRDAEAVIATYTRRSPLDGLHYAVPYWRTRGQYGRWRGARDSLSRILAPVPTVVRQIRSAAYLGDEPGAMPDLDDVLRSAWGADWPREHPAHAVSEARCWSAHQNLLRGKFDDVQAALAPLLTDSTDGRDAAALCAGMLATHLALSRRTGLDAAVRHLDSLVAPAPLIPWSMGKTSRWNHVVLLSANLLLGRAWLTLGDTAAARRAVRRGLRSDVGAVSTGEDYSEFVRLVALTTASLQPSQALRWYALYFRLRPNPPDHAPWRLQWDSVRAELQELQRVAR